MPNEFRDYRATGAPDASRARGAALTDLVIGALAGVLVWPFPVMRVVFTGLGGSPGAGWAIHIPALLLFMAFSAWLYDAILTVAARRTVGMYFSDLGFRDRLGPGQAFASALPWALAGLAALGGVGGPAERFAERRLASTKTGS